MARRSGRGESKVGKSNARAHVRSPSNSAAEKLLIHFLPYATEHLSNLPAVEGLEAALAKAAELPHEDPRQRLFASTTALFAVLEYLSAQEQLNTRGLLDPLRDLSNQLTTLYITGSAEMLRQKARLKTPHTFAKAQLDAYCAAAIEAFLLERTMGLREACNAVSHWLPPSVRRSPKQLHEKLKEFRRRAPALGNFEFLEAKTNFRNLLRASNGEAAPLREILSTWFKDVSLRELK